MLSSEQQRELEALLHEKGSSLPPLVVVALTQYLLLLRVLSSTATKLKQVLSELRRALGITPSSERRVSRRPLGLVGQDEGQRPASARSGSSAAGRGSKGWPAGTVTWAGAMARKPRILK